MALSDGLYDLLLTEGLARSLGALEPGSAEVHGRQGFAVVAAGDPPRVHAAE